MDLYKILNIDKNASKETIKKAYRRASLKHHPDRGGNSEDFKKINRAYEVLGDPIKKREYDMKMNSPFYNNSSSIFANDNNINEGVPDFFKMFFGGGGPIDLASMAGVGGPGGVNGHPNIHIFRNGKPVFTRNMKPTPITKTLKIKLADAYNGINLPLEIERWIIVDNIKKVEKETIYVDIPRGIDNNEIIMIENKGNITDNGLQGDVKVFINIEKNKNFERRGLDLIINKEITLKDALTGFKFEIEHLNGKTYAINNTDGKIMETGDKSIIDGMGMFRNNRKGRLIIVFHIHFPKKLSKEKKEKLRELL
tara:strand:- start:456 stop:1385 length:930 start_codon:yes stop_codon:yes gene_type:complete